MIEPGNNFVAPAESDFIIVRVSNEGGASHTITSLIAELDDAKRAELDNWISSSGTTAVDVLGWPGWTEILRRRYSPPALGHNFDSNQQLKER